MDAHQQIEAQVTALARNALKASRLLASLPTADKNALLTTLADLLEERRDLLAAENAKDIQAAEANGLQSHMVDRLRLTDKRIAQMAQGVREVAALPDPVGTELERIERPNGLDIRKVRVPIGVIGIIYESRPNVTIDCAALCFKSGNASILRGGSEAFHSNRALVQCIEAALDKHNLPRAAVSFVGTTDRYALNCLLKLDQFVHCIIPRGGEGLIRFVAENARMPVIKHYKGVCTAYIDKAADPDMAIEIVLNAKTQRPSVCNAIENLAIHQEVLSTIWPRIATALTEKGVAVRCDTRSLEAVQTVTGVNAQPVAEQDYYEEFLDLTLAVKTVTGVEDAVDFINTYGSGHSDAIVTSDEAAARYFLNNVDSATVYWNASTRFTDGFEFGMGAEIGISTDKLHARGPMGLAELTSYKYVIYGKGQVRQ